MIQFTDPRLYLKGTCLGIGADPKTGQILFYDNKFQTANFQTSLTMGEIRAGLGNAIATMLGSDSAVTVNGISAAFNLAAKMAQVGGTLRYNASAPVCQVVTADSAVLKVNVASGAPVAQVGMSKVLCYVQTVGESSLIAQDGIPYPITADGTVTGFTAESGKQYKVWYFINKASAQLGTITSMMNPKVLHWTMQMPVYANANSESNGGTRVGWLYAIVPMLKLNGDGGGVVGDQTTPDTTSYTGQALIADEDVVSGTCDNCGEGVLAHYLYVPDEASADIKGLAIVGGVVSVPVSGTAKVNAKFVMANGQLVDIVPANQAKYALTGAPSGTSVSADGVITAGATAGSTGEITVTYPATGAAQFTCTANLAVVSE